MENSMDPSSSQLQRYAPNAANSSTPVGTPIKLAPSAAAFRKGTPNTSRTDASADSAAKAKEPRSFLGGLAGALTGW